MMKCYVFKNSWLRGQITTTSVLLFLSKNENIFLEICKPVHHSKKSLIHCWVYGGILVFNSQHGLRKILRLRWSGLLLILFSKWGNKYRLYRNGFHRRVWTPQSSFVFYKSHRKWAALNLSWYPFPIVVEFLNHNPSTVLARLLIVEMYSLLEITWRRGQCRKRRNCCLRAQV